MYVAILKVQLNYIFICQDSISIKNKNKNIEKYIMQKILNLYSRLHPRFAFLIHLASVSVRYLTENVRVYIKRNRT